MAESDDYKIPAAECCLGYSNLACAEVRLDSMESFIERVRADKPMKLWSCYSSVCDKFAPGDESDSKSDVKPMNIFFYIHGNIILSASSEGFKTIADYLDAVELGFFEFLFLLLVSHVFIYH